MRAEALEIVDKLRSSPPPLDAVQIDRGRAFLQWLADDHFAFLGYREYRLEREGDDEILRAVPGTGLGILRHDQDQSKAFAKLPDAAKAKAREKNLLVLSKANSRATVHRPAYLDYVGVKTFDENGEVSGERRFLGLLSSAAYTESITRIPLLREKATEVLARIGVEPRSHAGKSLMDTLETYPRDEIFHTPAEELAEVDPGRAPDRRATPAAGLRAPRDLRPLRLGALLPPARPLQHRRARAVLADPDGPLPRRVHRVQRQDERVDDRAGALRRAPAAGRRDPRRRRRATSSGCSPTRPARGATTSSPRPSPSTARTTARGSPAATPTPSPRPTRRTSPPPRPRSTWAAWRRSTPTRASTSRCSRRSTPAAARLG